MNYPDGAIEVLRLTIKQLEGRARLAREQGFKILARRLDGDLVALYEKLRDLERASEGRQSRGPF